MSRRCLAIALAALFACLAAGQTSTQPEVVRVFHGSRGEREGDLQQMALVARVIADTDATADAAEGSVSLRGRAERILLAEWLLNQLERPEPRSHESVAYDHPVETLAPAVRVLRLARVETDQELNELITVVRTIAGLNRVVGYAGQRALAVRGMTDQVALADWLVSQLDRPAPPSDEPAAYDYPADKRQPAVRVFSLSEIRTPEGLNELITAIRTVADEQYVVAYLEPPSVVVRGSADQVALIEWLVRQLDQAGAPSREPAAYDYRAGGRDTAVRVFRLDGAATEPGWLDVFYTVRMIGGVPKTTCFDAQRALIVRGTEDQVALVGWLVGEFDRPEGAQRPDAAPHEFSFPGQSQAAVHVFHLRQTLTDGKSTISSLKRK